MTDRQRRWIRLAGVVVGLALLSGAIIVIWNRRELVQQAIDALASPSPTLIALLLACMLGNLLLTGAMFHQLMNRFGRVGMLEMQALIAASALANYLPLRPGLFGRVAYHASANGIPAKYSLLTVLQAVALTAVCAAIVLVVLLVESLLGARSIVWLAPIPAVILLLVALVADRQGMRPWCLAALARYLDLMLWGARYAIVFALIGKPIGLPAALAFACVGTIATMVPFSSNGLGLREWAIGLLAAQLATAPLELGIAAELVNRAAEMIVITLAGLAGAAWLVRRARATPQSPNRAP